MGNNIGQRVLLEKVRWLVTQVGPRERNINKELQVFAMRWFSP
jgi:hypothetical protein